MASFLPFLLLRLISKVDCKVWKTLEWKIICARTEKVGCWNQEKITDILFIKCLDSV
jgi:hypothetical protein